MVLVFMNKCDILKRKLDRGVPVKKYMPSYSDRANDFPTFSKCESHSMNVYGCD